MKTRLMSVASLFYPNNCEDIKRWIKKWETSPAPLSHKGTKALIVPHAGYVYSGETAFKAYKSVDNEVSQVVVVGPSHKVSFKGASIGQYETLQTPCSPLICDKALIEALSEKFDWLTFLPNAHEEHSTEVQFPLIDHFFPKATVVEIVYSDVSALTLSALLEECSKLPKTLLVISTDLSHFHPLERAKTLDSFCLKAIRNLNTKDLEYCEACGITGIAALINLASKKGWETKNLEYTTSYEHSKDSSSVVGYASAVLV
ncbi:MAG: AmmeMemoRadiSam system protein B [Campylobacteraceae bacterium]|nr:AmmeMemoRadiSam system protein B [Campylobacteraceae bacterium]